MTSGTVLRAAFFKHAPFPLVVFVFSSRKEKPTYVRFARQNPTYVRFARLRMGFALSTGFREMRGAAAHSSA